MRLKNKLLIIISVSLLLLGFYKDKVIQEHYDLGNVDNRYYSVFKTIKIPFLKPPIIEYETGRAIPLDSDNEVIELERRLR